VALIRAINAVDELAQELHRRRESRRRNRRSLDGEPVRILARISGQDGGVVADESPHSREKSFNIASTR